MEQEMKIQFYYGRFFTELSHYYASFCYLTTEKMSVVSFINLLLYFGSFMHAYHHFFKSKFPALPDDGQMDNAGRWFLATSQDSTSIH